MLPPGDAYPRLVHQACKECFFSQHQLEREVSRTFRTYLDELDRIERQTWQLRGMEKPPQTVPGTVVGSDPRIVHALVNDVITRARAATTRAIRDEVVTAWLATLIGEGIAQGTVRVGVTAGIWGLGAAASPITYGGSLAAAWAVDLILPRAWDAWTDPSGSLSATISARLVELQRVILEGDDRAPGLRSHLRRIVQTGIRNRHASVQELLLLRNEP